MAMNTEYKTKRPGVFNGFHRKTPPVSSRKFSSDEMDQQSNTIKPGIDHNSPHLSVIEAPFHETQIMENRMKPYCNDNFLHDEIVHGNDPINCNERMIHKMQCAKITDEDKCRNPGSRIDLHIENRDAIVLKEQQKSVDIDVMLSIVDGYGLFQKIANFMICIMAMPASFQLIIIYFAADTPNWKCAFNSTVCVSNKTFVKDDRSRCDLPRSEWQYAASKDYSIVTQFDISCQDDWLISLTTTIFFIGFIIGAIVLGWCADNYGRTKTLFCSMVALLVVGFITAFMPTFYLFTICRFIVGFFCPVIAMAFMVMHEMVGEEKRSLASIMVLVFTTSGTCLVCPKAYFARKWKLLYILCTAPYAFVLLFFMFIPESVRFLRVKGRTEEAMAVFHRIAKWNKKSVPKNVILSKLSSNVTSRISSPLDLFRTSNLAVKTLIQGYIWYAFGMVYFGLFLAAEDLDGGLYRDIALLNASEIPAIFAIIYLIEHFGRKKPIMITLFIGSMSCAVIGFIPKHGNMGMARLTLGIVAKCFTAASYDAVHTWSSEIYPSNIRGVGMGFAQFTTRIGNASAPWIANELKRMHPAAPFVLMGTIPFGAFFLMFRLPETRGVATSDSDKELDNKICSKRISEYQ